MTENDAYHLEMNAPENRAHRKVAAPFPPTPCRVHEVQILTGTPRLEVHNGEASGDIDVFGNRVFKATAVPRAQWEAVLDLWYALRDYERSLARGDTPEHDDIAKRFYDAQDHLATFFPEAL